MVTGIPGFRLVAGGGYDALSRGEEAPVVMLRRAQIVNLVEHSYYSNIDFRRLGTVLDCFARDAVLSVDGRPHRGRDGEIKQYLTQMLADYPTIRHEVLSHEADEAAQRSTCRFTLRLERRRGTRARNRRARRLPPRERQAGRGHGRERRRRRNLTPTAREGGTGPRP